MLNRQVYAIKVDPDQDAPDCLHCLLLGIIALKASGRDCTNNNELLHKIGVLQRYDMELFVFTRELYNRFDGAVSITVLLRETNNKADGSSPTIIFFIFLFFFFFAFANMQEIFRDLHVCRKKACLMSYAHVKRLHSVQWRSLYGDTATMQELLLEMCTRSARWKRSLEGNCH